MNPLIARAARVAATFAMVVLAGIAGWQLWVYYMDMPWTRDGRVRAEIVAVAPDVSGLVSEVLVEDNQQVRRGDVLFRIDRDRFAIALDQAEAVVESRAASLQRARLDAQRYARLDQSAVSRQRQEQAMADAAVAEAAWREAMADRDRARLDLARTEVHASTDGIITNLSLRRGSYVSAGHAVLALVDTTSLHVEGYFEETKLSRIHPGDPVEMRLMGDSAVIRGHVESIAGGIEDRERTSGASLMANVNPTFSWVRLAQRVPVRIGVDAVPEGVQLIPGRTATVSVLPPEAGRTVAAR